MHPPRRERGEREKCLGGSEGLASAGPKFCKAELPCYVLKNVRVDFENI